MAKALFSKGQRVFVKPVGAWATIERILPHWVKGVEEPLKVFYDVGLGRDFQGHELAAETREVRTDDFTAETWRLARMKNRWLTDGDAVRHRHPHPGTYPVVVTDEQDWGGWRVPSAEYDRDPERVEFQARIIANGLKMLRVTRDLSKFGAEFNDGLPDRLKDLVSAADEILRNVYETETQAERVAAE
jgi:hypothetical protein